jgi:hypothetical protein
MLVLIVGLGLFFLPHAVAIFASFWRDWMVLIVGALQWKGQCALIASAGFGGAHLGLRTCAADADDCLYAAVLARLRDLHIDAAGFSAGACCYQAFAANISRIVCQPF